MEAFKNIHINKAEIKNVHNELMRRLDKLLKFAYSQNIPMKDLDRNCIIEYFNYWKIPEKPKDIPALMKIFFTCLFTYAPVRKYLSSIIGKIPTSNDLPYCLYKIYDEKGFLTDQNWTPTKLHHIAAKIQQKEGYDLRSKKFKPRMISVFLDGTKEMEKRLKRGIEEFYQELERLNKGSGEEMWEYAKKFSMHIYNVGTALICDFLKDIGCDRFVKVDHHFKKEFPSLLGLSDCKQLSPKEHFILSQEISKIIKISPFHLDHLLYQWGRYKKYDQ